MREEPWCAEGLGQAWSAMVDAQTRVMALIGPWQYQCSREALYGSWVVPGIPPLPVPTHRTNPGYTLPPHPPLYYMPLAVQCVQQF